MSKAAVMSPIHPKRVASPMLFGGPHAAEFLPIARQLGFIGASVFSDQIGSASAAKMCRSVMVKGMEALLGESLLAARHYGVEDAVLESLGRSASVGRLAQLGALHDLALARSTVAAAPRRCAKSRAPSAKPDSSRA